MVSIFLFSQLLFSSLNAEHPYVSAASKLGSQLEQDLRGMEFIRQELPTEFVTRVFLGSPQLDLLAIDFLCRSPDEVECHLQKVSPARQNKMDEEDYPFELNHFLKAIAFGMDDSPDPNAQLLVWKQAHALRTLSFTEDQAARHGYAHFHKDRNSGETHFDWHPSGRPGKSVPEILEVTTP